MGTDSGISKFARSLWLADINNQFEADKNAYNFIAKNAYAPFLSPFLSPLVCEPVVEEVRMNKNTPTVADPTSSGGDKETKSFYFAVRKAGTTKVRFRTMFRGNVEKEYSIEVVATKQ